MDTEQQGSGEQRADEERELADLEEEAALLEARAQHRGGTARLRRILRVQAPVLVALAVVGLLWGRSAPQQATAATPPPASPPLIGLSDAYLAPPASGTGPMYAYVTIKNNGGSADRLVGGSSPWAQQIDLVNGASATSVPWITVPAHGSVSLRTGAERIALTDLTRAPKIGDTIQLDLNFATSGTVYVFAPVGPAASLSVPDVIDAMKHMDALPPTK